MADPDVVILEVRKHGFDEVPDLVVVGNELQPWNLAFRQRGVGDTRDNGGFRPQVRGSGRQLAARCVHHGHGIFHRDRLWPSGLYILLGPSEAGQDDRVLANQQVRAVELRRDVDGKVQVAHRLEALLRVRQCHRQIASQAYKYLGAPIQHRFHRGDGIVPVVTGGLESKGPLDVLQHRRRGFLPDADCAIALNV